VKLHNLAAALAIGFCILSAPTSAGAADDTSIWPFKIQVPQAALDDLRRRIAQTRWPDRETVDDQSQGIKLEKLKPLVEYWGAGYDWRKAEAKLNVMPLIMTHGWPGSIIEQLKIIDPLTNPTANGASAWDAFHLVIPSLPGYGFSGKPTSPGWGPERIAGAWIELMKRLAYRQFVAQGGDWGALIVDLVRVQASSELLGIHTNMAGAVPPEIDKAAHAGANPPPVLSAEGKKAFDQLVYFYKYGLAYALEMASRPQTLYGIADSPLGLTGWILGHDIRSYQLIARTFGGQSEGLTRDDVLDNISLYWLTNTAVSASRLYWENKFAVFAPKNVKIPVAVSTFPDEIYAAPRSWVEKAYPNLIHYNKLDKGGHFAAWEQPQLFAEEVRKSFRSLRSSG